MSGAEARLPGDRQAPEDALAAVARMESKVNAAIEEAAGGPGCEHYLTELAWFSAQLCEVRQALEESAGRQYAIAQAWQAGMAAGLAHSAATRRTAARRSRPGTAGGAVTVLRPTA